MRLEGGCSSCPIHEDPEMAKAEMADYLQEQLMDVGVERFWPTCTDHNSLGLHAEVRVEPPCGSAVVGTTPSAASAAWTAATSRSVVRDEPSFGTD